MSGGMTGLEFLRQYPPLSGESTIHISWQNFPILTKVHFGRIPLTFHHHFWGDLLGVLVAIICIDTHLKTNMFSLKGTIFIGNISSNHPLRWVFPSTWSVHYRPLNKTPWISTLHPRFMCFLSYPTKIFTPA